MKGSGIINSQQAENQKIVLLQLSKTEHQSRTNNSSHELTKILDMDQVLVRKCSGFYRTPISPLEMTVLLVNVDVFVAAL